MNIWQETHLVPYCLATLRPCDYVLQISMKFVGQLLNDSPPVRQGTLIALHFVRHIVFVVPALIDMSQTYL